MTEAIGDLVPMVCAISNHSDILLQSITKARIIYKSVFNVCTLHINLQYLRNDDL